MKCHYNGGFVPVGNTVKENKHYQIDELVAALVDTSKSLFTDFDFSLIDVPYTDMVIDEV